MNTHRIAATGIQLRDPALKKLVEQAVREEAERRQEEEAAAAAARAEAARLAALARQEGPKYLYD